MNCDIIKDLLPLYIDECCSEESANEVKKHLEKCKECDKLYKNMTSQKNESFIKEKEVAISRNLLIFIAHLCGPSWA